MQNDPIRRKLCTITGRLSNRPTPVDKGTYGLITIRLSDSKGASDSVTFTIKIAQGTAGSLPGVILLLEEKQ